MKQNMKKKQNEQNRQEQKHRTQQIKKAKQKGKHIKTSTKGNLCHVCITYIWRENEIRIKTKTTQTTHTNNKTQI